MFRTAAISLHCIFLLPLVQHANAAKLVVMAVNSGSDITAPFANDQPPTMTPGAKGFLIGVDTEDSIIAPLGGSFYFRGVINKTINHPKTQDYPSWPDVLTLTDAVNNPTMVDYRRDDTYLMDNIQVDPITGTPHAWELVFRFRANVDVFDAPAIIRRPEVSGGVRMFAYVVATGDVSMEAWISRGNGYTDALGAPLGTPGRIYLDFDDNTIKRVPEPSSLLLCLFALAAAVLFRRRGI